MKKSYGFLSLQEVTPATLGIILSTPWIRDHYSASASPKDTSTLCPFRLSHLGQVILSLCLFLSLFLSLSLSLSLSVLVCCFPLMPVMFVSKVQTKLLIVKPIKQITHFIGSSFYGERPASRRVSAGHSSSPSARERKRLFWKRKTPTPPTLSALPAFTSPATTNPTRLSNVSDSCLHSRAVCSMVTSHRVTSRRFIWEILTYLEMTPSRRGPYLRISLTVGSPSVQKRDSHSIPLPIPLRKKTP